MKKYPDPVWLILPDHHTIIRAEFDEDDTCMEFTVFEADQNESDLGWEIYGQENYWPLRYWDEGY